MKAPIISMKQEHQNRIHTILPINKDDIDRYIDFFTIEEVPSEKILLSAGEIAEKLFLVIKGCLRIYFIKENGTEITSQFFFENQMVSSFESARTGTPSRQFIEAIEDTTVAFIHMINLETIIGECASARQFFSLFMMKRLIYYMNHHASFILDNPQKRYINLLKENPDIISRVPQQHIASYLGITPVSLSRIKARLAKRINNC